MNDYGIKTERIMNTDYTTVWKECLAELEKNPTVSAVALDVFIRTLEPIMIHDGNLVLMSATENNKNIINKCLLWCICVR